MALAAIQGERTLAKTDRLDAAMLARMGQQRPMALTTSPGKALQDLRELHLLRQASVEQRTAASNRKASLSLGLTKKLLNRQLAPIERHLAAIDQAIEALCDQSHGLERRRQLLTSFPRHRRDHCRRAHRPDAGTRADHGQTPGRPRAHHQTVQRLTRQGLDQGRARQLRQALYLPAVVACRYNPNLKALYRRLVKAGKPKKLAIIAVMRKLLILANTLIREEQTWEDRPARSKYGYCKEVYLKATGEGMALPLHAFAVSLDPPGLIFIGELAGRSTRWLLRNFPLDDAHLSALAVCHPAPEQVAMTCRPQQLQSLLALIE